MDRAATIKRALEYLPEMVGQGAAEGTALHSIVTAITHAILEEVEADKAGDAQLFKDIAGQDEVRVDSNLDSFAVEALTKAVDKWNRCGYSVILDGVHINPIDLYIDFGDHGPDHWRLARVGRGADLGHIKMRILDHDSVMMAQKFQAGHFFEMEIDYLNVDGKVIRQVVVPRAYCQSLTHNCDVLTGITTEMEIVPAEKMQWVDV